MAELRALFPRRWEATRAVVPRVVRAPKPALLGQSWVVAVPIAPIVAALSVPQSSGYLDDHSTPEHASPIPIPTTSESGPGLHRRASSLKRAAPPFHVGLGLTPARPGPGRSYVEMGVSTTVPTVPQPWGRSPAVRPPSSGSTRFDEGAAVLLVALGTPDRRPRRQEHLGRRSGALRSTRTPSVLSRGQAPPEGVGGSGGARVPGHPAPTGSTAIITRDRRPSAVTPPLRPRGARIAVRDFR